MKQLSLIHVDLWGEAEHLKQQIQRTLLPSHKLSVAFSKALPSSDLKKPPTLAALRTAIAAFSARA